MRICFTGARIIDPSRQLDRQLDLLLAEGKVAALGENLPKDGARVIDLSGKIIVPGFVDLHVHLREPGYESKETICSGLSAAAAGGITSLACMPNTAPAVDRAEVVEQIIARAEQAGLGRVYPVGALTRKREGRQAADFASLYGAGVRAFSDDGSPVEDSRVLFSIFKELSRFDDVVVLAHSEDLSLSRGGVMHEGRWSKLLKQPGIPAVAESIAVARDILLAEAAGIRLHLCHISTAAAVEWVAWAKAKGLPVTAEVTPHHLLLTDAAVERCGALAKVNPPLRTEEDCTALRKALNSGIIDIIATDHAPHRSEEKELSLLEAPFGITGLETAVPLLLSELVNKNLLTLPGLVEAFSCRPARLLNLPAGTIKPGAPADLTVLDLNAPFVVEPQRFYSQARHSPFTGWQLTGLPVMTVVGGKIIMKEGVVSRASKF
ncbi:MAG TPA: dihydroorotase [Bacillota bacterium]|nr:dihydroorotase [Bacillota bacterium]